MIRPSSKERALRIVTLVAGDFLIGWGALFAIVLLRRNVNFAFTQSLLPPQKFVLDPPIVTLFAVSLVAALALSGFYHDRVTPRTRPSTVTALVIQAALVAIGSTVLVRPLPRTVLIAVPLLEAIALQLWRRILQLLAPIRPRETTLIGEPHDVEEAHRGLRFVGDRRIRIIEEIRPNLDDLADPALRTRLRESEEMILVSPDTDARLRLELLRIRGPRGFLMLASHADALLASSMLGWIGDQPLVEVAVSCGYGINASVKRGLDILGSLSLITLTSPIWIFAAIAIWLDDRGPILIRQQRMGRDGEPYGMLKFRSMRGPA
ncbi:MAG TPA: sugar transferase, partial [Thermoanaerobaculia bacterium]|nr:sugar transferase [Thermoanaerobaculia bacterium]